METYEYSVQSTKQEFGILKKKIPTENIKEII